MSKDTFLDKETKRSLIQSFLTVFPSVYYFNKNKKVILGSSIKQKSSYYSPESTGLYSGTINRMHHFKEIGFRLFLGAIVGFAATTYLFGLKEID